MYDTLIFLANPLMRERERERERERMEREFFQVFLYQRSIYINNIKPSYNIRK
jgi:hypothetical protein